MRHIFTILLISIVFVLIGVNGDEEESQKEVGIKRRNSNGRPMNPYSWRNRARRAMEDEFLAPEEVGNVQAESFVPMNKRAYRRNPYSWHRFAGPDSESGFFDTLFGGVKDKKSPYMFNYNDGRRARNPYSWQNYV